MRTLTMFIVALASCSTPGVSKNDQDLKDELMFVNAKEYPKCTFKAQTLPPNSDGEPSIKTVSQIIYEGHQVEMVVIWNKGKPNDEGRVWFIDADESDKAAKSKINFFDLLESCEE